jgi:hypothetical protein
MITSSGRVGTFKFGFVANDFLTPFEFMENMISSLVFKTKKRYKTWFACVDGKSVRVNRERSERGVEIYMDVKSNKVRLVEADTNL